MLNIYLLTHTQHCQMDAIIIIIIISVLDALSGYLPTSLGRLTALNRLSLHHNRYTGSIPHHWFQLKYLQVLLLHENQLSADVSSSSLDFLKDMIQLTTLKLHHNCFYGKRIQLSICNTIYNYN